jgi:hypothetical protein
VQLSGARVKARDAKRISDMSQIQLALEAYFEKSPVQSKGYPENLNELVSGGFIASIPRDDYQDRDYNYNKIETTEGVIVGYCLGTKLEKVINSLYNCESGGIDDNYKVKR